MVRITKIKFHFSKTKTNLIKEDQPPQDKNFSLNNIINTAQLMANTNLNNSTK